MRKSGAQGCRVCRGNRDFCGVRHDGQSYVDDLERCTYLVLSES